MDIYPLFLKKPPTVALYSTDLVELPDDFVPGEYDVICQRGKDSFEHVGNKKFRECIDNQVEMYMAAVSRQEKAAIVSKVLNHAQRKGTKPAGGFVKKDLLTRKWLQVSEKEARDKIGQALRDAIKIRRATRNKGQTTTKESRRTKNKPLPAFLGGSSDARPMDGTGMYYGMPIEGSSASTASSFLESKIRPLAGGDMTRTTPDFKAQKAVLQTPIEATGDSTQQVVQQGVDSTLCNNRKRSRTMEPRNPLNAPWIVGDRQDFDFSTVFSEEPLGTKRMIGTDGGSPFRRLSLLGDQSALPSATKSHSSILNQLDSSHSLSASLLGLPTSRGVQNKLNGDNAAVLESLAAGAGRLPNRSYADVFDSTARFASLHSHGLLDLEPTPLSTTESNTENLFDVSRCSQTGF